jgi:glycosyltransferase involved in cell wall biosynthesis
VNQIHLRVQYAKLVGRFLVNSLSSHSTTKQLNIHLWLPDIFQFKGGIQVYSAFLLQAIAEIYPNANLHVFLKHDTVTLPDSITGFKLANKPSYSFAGRFPLTLRTIAYTSQIVGAAIVSTPDLIIASHVNFSPAADWLKKIKGIPYWAIAHGIEVWNLKNQKIRSALQNADRILAVSEFTRDRMIDQQNLDPDQVAILPNTFDSKRFSIAPKPTYLLERYNLNRNHQILLTVARLDQSEQYKGYDQVLRAIPQVLTTIPDLHYLIVGKGNDTDRIKQMITELNLENNVTLVGFVPDSELNDYYNLCDLFVMPSKGEGFGIVFLEAIACGKPVIAGNQDGSVTALNDGKLGILIDPDNQDQLEQSITQVLGQTYIHPLIYHPEKLRSQVITEFGKNAFKKQLKHYLEQQLGSKICAE